MSQERLKLCYKRFTFSSLLLSPKMFRPINLGALCVILNFVKDTLHNIGDNCNLLLHAPKYNSKIYKEKVEIFNSFDDTSN